MKEVREEMKKALDNKYESGAAKMGIYTGFGLM